MNIAFWSNTGGSGVTANMTALGIAGICSFPFRITLLENHKDEGLSRALFGSRWSNILRFGEASLYIGGDSHSFIRELSSKMNRKVISNMSIEIIENRLFYFYSKHNLSKELYEYDFYENVYPLLEKAIQHGDVNFIDTEKTNNLSTKDILAAADLVVVNLRQNMSEIENFFEEYKSLLSKVIIILSGFQRHKNINPTLISQKYGLSENKITYLSYNSNFKNAYEEGRMAEFIISNYNCIRKNENYRFIKSLKDAANILFTNAASNNDYIRSVLIQQLEEGVKRNRINQHKRRNEKAWDNLILERENIRSI